MSKVVWTQDRDYMWHAFDDEAPTNITFCGPIDWAHGGIFNYPRHMLAFSDMCKTCNDKATEISNERV